METTWLEAADLARLRPAAGPFARALVCDLRDPALAALAAAPPTPEDLADEARPGASPRTWFRARRAVLRGFAGLCLGLPPADVVVAYDDAGAPRLRGGGAFVSVAGRGPLAALAVSDAPVGIDLEPCAPPPAPVAEVLHPQERRMLETAPEDLRPALFLRIWTAKEAVLKAMGGGLTHDPATLAIALRARDFLARGAPPLRSSSFHTRGFDDGAALAACAVLRAP